MDNQHNFKEQITATILAGGKSSRMGTDKALITLGNDTWLAKTCQIAFVCSIKVQIVTPWPEKYQAIIPPKCELIQEVPLLGENINHGPLVGFAQGLVQVETEWVLLLACDLPCLEVQQLLEWCQYLNLAPKNVIALLPRRSEVWEPLCGFYRRSCLLSLNQFIQRGGRSFQQWLKQNYVQELPVINSQMLFNCNTPEDLTEILH